MKKVLIPVALIAIAALIYAFAWPESTNTPETVAVEEGKIQWYSWDEAMKLQKDNPKKIFIDVYTDWCGWCKRMDATTFVDPKVVGYVNQNFYAIKLDAEQKEDIVYDGHTFKFIPSGSRGVHELAYALLDGQLGYPAYVYLNEEMQRITISPGYKPVEPMIQELEYIGGDHYKTQSFDKYKSGR